MGGGPRGGRGPASFDRAAGRPQHRFQRILFRHPPITSSKPQACRAALGRKRAPHRRPLSARTAAHERLRSRGAGVGEQRDWRTILADASTAVHTSSAVCPPPYTYRTAALLALERSMRRLEIPSRLTGKGSLCLFESSANERTFFEGVLHSGEIGLMHYRR